MECERCGTDISGVPVTKPEAPAEIKEKEAPETVTEEVKVEEAETVVKEAEAVQPEFKSTLLWDEKYDKKSGRQLGHSPFFTDGKHFFVISIIKDVRKLEEDEERASPKLVLE